MNETRAALEETEGEAEELREELQALQRAASDAGQQRAVLQHDLEASDAEVERLRKEAEAAGAELQVHPQSQTQSLIPKP